MTILTSCAYVLFGGKLLGAFRLDDIVTKVHIMANSSFRTIVSWSSSDIITVGNQRFYALAVYVYAAGRRVLVVTKQGEETPYRAGTPMPKGEPFELSPGVRIPFTEAHKPAKLKLRIELLDGVPLIVAIPRRGPRRACSRPSARYPA